MKAKFFFLLLLTLAIGVCQCPAQATKSYTFKTFAGLPGTGGTTDGTGTVARFRNPVSIVVDIQNNLYVADRGNSTIRKISPGGVVTTFAGRPLSIGSSDGVATEGRFSNPDGVAVDALGNVFVADTGNSTIRKIAIDGVVSTIAGVPKMRGSTDGHAAAARFDFPEGIVVDIDGNIYVADTGNSTIRKISPSAEVTTLAGLAGFSVGGADGFGSEARFNGPSSLAVDLSGSLFIADRNNNTVRKVASTGFVTTLAGLVRAGGAVDGKGSEARFGTTSRGGPSGIALEDSGNLFVADLYNHTIRRVSPAADVTTVAGLAGTAGTQEGAGSSARFNTPTGVAVDSEGNLYVADTLNHTIRKGTPPVAAVAPTITVQPIGQTALVGGHVVFAVTVVGTAPLTYQWLKNTQIIPGATTSSFALTNIVASDAGDYSVSVSNSAGLVTSAAVFLSVTTVFPLDAALNTTNLLWKTGGDKPWLTETNIAYSGLWATQAGSITNRQSSWIETTLVGPGILTFWAKVSSELAYDQLSFHLDSEPQFEPVSGELDWHEIVLQVPSGSHTARWTYSKDHLFYDGQDGVWLDAVTFAPE